METDESAPTAKVSDPQHSANLGSEDIEEFDSEKVVLFQSHNYSIPSKMQK